MAHYSHGTAQIFHEVMGRGEPILFLPGFSERTSDHSKMLNLLAAQYRVIAADLPGSGRSLPQPRNYSATYYQDDAEALSALIRTLTDGPVHLVSFSDGGQVALLIAALYQELARSVLVWGAAGVISDPLVSVLDALSNVVDHPSPPFEDLGPYLVAAYGEQNARAMMQNVTTAWKAIVAAGGDISRSMAGDIACPVLLIVGEHDPFCPKILADDFAGAARNATAIEVAGAGHDVHNARPDWFNQTVLDWLSKN